MQNIIPYLKKVFSGINHPVFFAVLIVSFGLWYFNQLGHIYITTVTLPLRIESGADSPIGVLENETQVECRVEGTGYQLLRYRAFPRSGAVIVNLRNIDLMPVAGTNRSEVTNASLFNALSAQLENIRLLAVLTPRVEIVTAPFNTKRVPVRSRITVELANQFMPIGELRLSPDSVQVKSLDVLLDTLQAVYTEPREYTDVRGNLSRRIPLEPIRDVVLPLSEVEFELRVEEYTEIDLTLPIALENAPRNLKPIILPGEVSVRLNVSRSRYATVSTDEIRAFIDYDDRLTNRGRAFKVYVPASEGIVVKEVTPLYVELVFEER
ncbi:MAG: hypothetical protein LBM20_03170 [Rikenellaceae bacterium]|jgi:hypothetical protein|nr:hypothetical protein [Rikenellaceae bacterium]